MPSLLHTAYSVSAIRTAEEPIVAAAERIKPDGLMQQAARAVADVALSLLSGVNTPRVLVLAGSGGNGGDGLYAGAFLAEAGIVVEAIATSASRTTLPRATEAFTKAGGVLVDAPTAPAQLVIDAIAGLGLSAGLAPELAQTVSHMVSRGAKVLAVDVPSGISPDTGDPLGPHITADVTVTFGALRFAHTVSASCGDVVVADIGIAESLHTMNGPRVYAYRAVPADHSWPDTVTPTPAIPAINSMEPRPTDHKYSGGVVGLLAGSELYPGAGVLCVAGAVRATPAMVRYVGAAREFVLHAIPEVIASSLATAGKVQAWVAGPGGATESELLDLIRRPIPLLIDADGIRLLAKSTHLIDALRQREHPTVLTPHDGEFATLVAAIGIPEATTANRLAACHEAAQALGAIIVLKGRRTLIAPPHGPITSIDAGHSWSATPGSGDVLAGVMGAWIARYAAQDKPLAEAIAIAVHLCADAAWLSAQTNFGAAPTSASRIADAIPAATARLSNK